MGKCPYNSCHPLPVGRAVVAYCSSCSQIIFRCPEGHWNRAFSQFCTECGVPLEKPKNWDMAFANEARTAMVSSDLSIDELDTTCFRGSIRINPIDDAGDVLPPLLAFDGFVLVPNPNENQIDAYSIYSNDEAGAKWVIPFHEPLTLASTPIYHKLHLFYMMGGRLMKQSVLEQNIQAVDLNYSVSASIKPISTCMPLRFICEGMETLLVVLQDGLLWYNLETGEDLHIPCQFAADGDFPLSPVFFENQILLTTQRGNFYHFDLLEGQYWKINSTQQQALSAPVVVEGKVYAEAVGNNDERCIAQYNLHTRQIDIVAKLDDVSFDQGHFIYPPLTDGKRLFLAGQDGRSLYIYDTSFSTHTPLSPYKVTDLRGFFLSHRSIVVNNQIYSVTATGLTIFNMASKQWQHRTLALGEVGNPLSHPKPMAPPIRYGDKLFILCQDQLAGTNY